MNMNFKQQAIEASRKFNDNPVRPMNEAVYWIEYVVRHKKAEHLKSSSANFSLSKYLNYDVGLFFFITFAVSFLFWVYVIKFAIQRYQAREQKGKFKYY